MLARRSFLRNVSVQRTRFCREEGLRRNTESEDEPNQTLRSNRGASSMVGELHLRQRRNSRPLRSRRKDAEMEENAIGKSGNRAFALILALGGRRRARADLLNCDQTAASTLPQRPCTRQNPLNKCRLQPGERSPPRRGCRAANAIRLCRTAPRSAPPPCWRLIGYRRVSVFQGKARLPDRAN